MAKKQYYVVKRGKTPGIYFTWDECKQQVLNFPGAVYKGFMTEEEAKAYAGEAIANRCQSLKEPLPGDETKLAEGEAMAYVDGSYNDATGEYSCGVVFFYEGEEKHFSQKGEDAELAAMRNVAGEILGARIAMEQAVQCGVKTLIVVHDYQGIASWCTGDWKANKEGTKAYKAYFDSLKGKLKVEFQKVKGHSGNRYNDLADELARSAIF